MRPAQAMNPLRRHQLVWLDEYAWYRVLATATSSADPLRVPDSQALDCLSHWAQQRWPLVVTRQAAAVDAVDASAPDGVLALGLSAPARLGRHAIGVNASLRGVMRLGAFPRAVEVLTQLPAAAQAGWGLLSERLDLLDVVARVYGSHGWQQLTAMDYVHTRSDIDLLVEVGSAAQADQAAALLLAADAGPLRIDGELAFEDGAAVAWREWLRFRSGQADRILVKRLTGASLEDAAAWAAIA
jgi:phosphoribosyl-dephospho-CoA transferase